MTIDARIGGAARRVSTIHARIGGSLRQIASIHVRIGGALRQLYASLVQLETKSITLTSGYHDAGSYELFGYGSGDWPPVIGSLSSATLTGNNGGGTYTIGKVEEEFFPAISRRVILVARGGALPLSQNSFTSLVTPGGTLLTAAVESFVEYADGGLWQWLVTTGSDDGTADYLSSGTLTLNQ